MADTTGLWSLFEALGLDDLEALELEEFEENEELGTDEVKNQPRPIMQSLKISVLVPDCPAAMILKPLINPSANPEGDGL